ncbi:DNA helicase-2/ATP-dependent DNA helicase PcrA [Chitinivorax tropicus]|uniref:DNA 3'-5' helicase n=1 Tax=Chitinivorax tropicus TaxID=714531 RepID=A0A840MCT8_9PROT|nr:UvrD-helicase domain-containing protein [Chitinivorax tropicus]MBB5017124.1 DNA helicase-2/ATP-dependent DNA helicase PcrA [Chitinivorax tropicus]
MTSRSLLEGLNPEQLAAVTLPKQAALILAGAGSGKTRVLTTRIAWLLQTGQVSPQGILAVTFTNKAAKEMLTRISAMLPINTRGMWIGTFHGICNRLLRAHHREAGLPEAFQIMDSQDQLSLIKRLLKALNIDDEKYPAKQLQHFINGNKEAGLRAAQVVPYDDFTKRLVELYAAYEEQCQREGAVDFAELLLRCFELLTRNAMLRDHYRERFQHILVDEFQDTNKLQYLWLKLIAGDQAAIFAVGDDDQSIYAFRGAQVGNMFDFERDYQVKNVIKLEQNYRSFGNILDAANTLIQHNGTRLGKNLWTSAGSGQPLRVYEGSTDLDEAAFLVEEVKQLHREGLALQNMAILYRSNAQSRVIEHQLFSTGVPYRVYGGLRFFERQEIKHALAYLRLIANNDDDGALLRVINFPTRGIGARTIESIQSNARLSRASLWQAACSGGGSGRSGAAVAQFVNLIEDMRRRSEGLTLPEQVDMMLDQSGLRAFYHSEKDGQDRLDNLNELINAAMNYLAEADDRSLTGFLAHASLEAGDHQADAGADALQLMTVHSAKGLEFDAVFITGLEEGLFPHENASLDPAGLEEERRLMYVAITRARQKLYLTLSQSRMLHGQTRYNVGSRFLIEIPANLLHWLNKAQPAPKMGGFAPAGNSSARPTRSAQAEHGFHIGQSVLHAKFGVGVIIDCEGSGGGAHVQVNFGGSHGIKWLTLRSVDMLTASS